MVRGDGIKEEVEPGSQTTSSVGGGRVGSSSGSGGRIRTHGNAKERLASARAIVITGVGGVGKVSFRYRARFQTRGENDGADHSFSSDEQSSLVLECQTVVRAAGFYGLAKFDGESEEKTKEK